MFAAAQIREDKGCREADRRPRHIEAETYCPTSEATREARLNGLIRYRRVQAVAGGDAEGETAESRS